MRRDRKEICEIISNMLDSPKGGIYPTSTAFAALELYIEQVRIEAVGWTFTKACLILDRGEDPRLLEIPILLAAAAVELDKQEN